tara:strand:+ start:1122 stop:1238 length:117 start_codon:yes stop_codon:yes gene_type:complete
MASETTIFTIMLGVLAFFVKGFLWGLNRMKQLGEDDDA